MAKKPDKKNTRIGARIGDAITESGPAILLIIVAGLVGLVTLIYLIKPLLTPLSPLLKYVGVYKTEKAQITAVEAPSTCVIITERGRTKHKLAPESVYALCQKHIGAAVTVTYDPITGDLDGLKL